MQLLAAYIKLSEIKLRIIKNIKNANQGVRQHRVNSCGDLAHKTTHGYYITCVLKHPTQINLKYKGFQKFAPKNLFEFVHILAVCSARLRDIKSRLE